MSETGASAGNRQRGGDERGCSIWSEQRPRPPRGNRCRGGLPAHRRGCRAGAAESRSRPGVGDPAQPTISYVAQRDIAAAATTLVPSAAGPLVEEAQSCKIPLASLTIAKGTAAVGSTIRIRSGSYVSPYFTVTEPCNGSRSPTRRRTAQAPASLQSRNAQGAILGLSPQRS